jgi:poly(beta-D-mannuronate) C5 epimerase
MRNAVALVPMLVAIGLAGAIAPAMADEITARLPEVASELTYLMDDPLADPAAFFASVAQLGFAQRANYDVNLVPQVPARAKGLPLARLLPFAVVLDAALGKVSAQTLDNITDAQGEQSLAAIYFEQGPVFLSDIKAALVQLALPVDEAETARVSLSRPLVLSSRATLVLLPGEELTLDRAQGAFLIAAGGMVIDRASIVGSEPANSAQLNFRPFILADASSGPVQLSGAHFQRLGFGSDPRSAGLSITGSSAARSFVQDSTLSQMGTLSVVDAAQSTIRRNVFDHPFNTALTIVSSSSVIVDGNVVMGSSSGHGIKLGPNATQILVSDNIVADNNKHGLLLEGNTSGSVIFNNLLLENDGSGIAILNGSCLSLEQNQTLANAADGIMVRNSTGLNLATNTIAANRRTGVSIVGANGSVQLDDNRFDSNKVGLRASTSFDLALSDNDWTGQTPRLLDGDVSQHTLALLAGIKSGDTDLSMAGLPLPADLTASLPTCKPGEAI